MNFDCKTEIQPKLYLLPTPIGNLGDITYRTLDTLKKVDAIFCEDTRNTLKLLNYFDIKKPVYSCHEHNEEQRANEICELVKSGKAIAFVSDAGMPAVSDPGERLIKTFIQHSVPFEVQPGANAMLTAWVMSGLSTRKMYFCGFLPRSGAERAKEIENIRLQRATTVIYESPLRVGGTLFELYEKLGDRSCVIVREITKIHEEVIRGNLSELAKRYHDSPLKGECVIVIGETDNRIAPELEKAEQMMKMLLDCNVRIRDAAKITSFALNISKNEAYRLAIENFELE